MMPRPSLTVAARTALRLAGLLAVLAGLFGMHGLANHGVPGAENMPHGVIAATSEATASAVSAAMPVHPADAEASGLGATSNTAAAVIGTAWPPGIDLDMAGLCMALLVMGLGAIVLLRRIGRGALVLWVQSRVSTATAASGLRDSAPPSLTLLSIRRC